MTKRKTSAGAARDASLVISPWALAKVTPYERNPRRHSEQEVRRLAEFIARIGFRKPLEVDEDGVLLAGHRRLKAAQLLALETVPVIQHLDLTPEEKKAYRIADNRLALEGEWDDELLRGEFQGVGGVDLTSLGFSDAEIRKVLDTLPNTDEPEPEPETPEAPSNPVALPADVWKMGEHRLVCGDSLDPKVRAVLEMRGKVDMVFTDPPYAIYGSSTGVASDITDDKMVRPFFRDVLLGCLDLCRTFAHVYVCCDWRSYPSWWEVAKGTGIVPKNMVVWDKGGGGLGANYANSHELLLFSWIKPLRQNMTQKITGGRQVNDSNVWRVNRVPSAGKVGGREHNAQKPVDLVVRAIENSSDPGGSVLDLFMGSGTTLIAAQKTGRRCFGFEIAPAYVDVAIMRWQRETGLKATLGRTRLDQRGRPGAGLEDSGKTFDEVAALREKARKPRKSR